MKALQRALDAAPCSQRTLAFKAGVSPTLLTLMTQGKKSLTDNVAQRLITALHELSEDCTTAADIITQSLKGRRS